jgi:hypothetical protein
MIHHDRWKWPSLKARNITEAHNDTGQHVHAGKFEIVTMLYTNDAPPRDTCTRQYLLKLQSVSNFSLSFS